jgi:hypothetical protein
MTLAVVIAYSHKQNFTAECRQLFCVVLFLDLLNGVISRIVVFQLNDHCRKIYSPSGNKGQVSKTFSAGKLSENLIAVFRRIISQCKSNGK